MNPEEPNPRYAEPETGMRRWVLEWDHAQGVVASSADVVDRSGATTSCPRRPGSHAGEGSGVSGSDVPDDVFSPRAISVVTGWPEATAVVRRDDLGWQPFMPSRRLVLPYRRARRTLKARAVSSAGGARIRTHEVLEQAYERHGHRARHVSIVRREDSHNESASGSA